MYHGFLYIAFKSGIVKAIIDDQPWEDTGILSKQIKIEQEDQIISLCEAEENKGSDLRDRMKSGSFSA